MTGLTQSACLWAVWRAGRPHSEGTRRPAKTLFLWATCGGFAAARGPQQGISGAARRPRTRTIHSAGLLASGGRSPPKTVFLEGEALQTPLLPVCQQNDYLASKHLSDQRSQ